MTSKVEDAAVSIWGALFDLASKLIQTEQVESEVVFDLSERALRSAGSLDCEDTGLHMVQQQIYDKADKTFG